MTEGLSKQGLDNLHEVLAGHVDRSYVPGLVALVSRGGDVHVEALGSKAFDGDEPMQRDTIFRIASMTKPITAVAALSLVEDGAFGLDDLVEQYVPELADRQVLTAIDAPLDSTVPAKRPPTVRDLLTFTMGFGAVLAPPLTYPIQRALRERSLGGDAPPQPQTMPGPDEWIRRFAELPFMHQPGEGWAYHHGTEVLSVLIQRVTGASLGSCLDERVLGSTGMRDTGFSVPAGKLGRLATSYDADVETGEVRLFDPVDGSQWASPPPFESGGGGLVSTVDDYHAFTRMLLNGGAANGHQVISPDSVRAMTTNHLSPEQRSMADPIAGDGGGWGYGIAVSPARYGWSGGLGTTWWTAPDPGLIGILLTQRTVFPTTDTLHLDFWSAAKECVP